MMGNDATIFDIKHFLSGVSAALRAYADQFGEDDQISGQLHSLARDIELVEFGSTPETQTSDEDLELT